MKTKRIFQKTQLKSYRKLNRNNQTEAERILWKYLRKKQLAGYRFQRQYSIDNYILDFYCPKARLGIELDGGHHAKKDIAKYDRIRTKHIESYDIKILRFWNNEVKKNIYNVLETIFYYIGKA